MKIFLLNFNNFRSRLNQILDIAEPPIIVFANEKKKVEVLAKIVEKWNVNIFYFIKIKIK